jgi:eukaryotic-like serine/threonine-protein kinase
VSLTLDELMRALPPHYVVQREIGQGGMATVYLAEDRRHQRLVAIKVLKPELGSSINAERFKREIQIAARMSHPNILAAYDSGESNGLFYYVMPFVEGESLRRRISRESQLPIEDAVAITCEVADALAYAHSQGVVHRDIKPENILLQSGHAVVADFGIASVLQDSTASKLTETGTSIGTVAYMSPEQLSGEKVDARGDMYSLGCVLYEMLVGQVPFTGPNQMVIMARHTMEQVPSIRIARQTVPPEVEDAILRALEKVPADRFSSMEQFRDALLGLAPGAATYAGRTLTPRMSRRIETPPPPPWKRRVLGASALVAALLVIATAGLLVQRGARGTSRAASDPAARRIAVLYFADRSGNGELRPVADGLTETLIDALARVPVLDVISRNGVAPFRGKSVGVDSVRRALQVGSLVRGEVEPDGDRVKVTVRLVDAAADVDIAHTSIELDTTKVHQLQDSVANEVARFLRTHLGTEIQVKERRSQTASADAWMLVQRAEKRRKDADSIFATGQLESGLAALDEADSLLVRGAAADPQWSEPLVLRAASAYRRSRALRQTPASAAAAIDTGLAAVERVLARDPRNAFALEVRGELRMQRVVLRLMPEGPEADRLLEAAEQDLRRAVDENPAQAGAWASLTSLDYRRQAVQQAVLDAQNAYKYDAYLANAREILNRLFWTSHDTEVFPDAAKWCAEGHRRFPREPFFVECALWMLTTKYAKADPDSAWRIYDSLKAVTPARAWPMQGRFSQMIVAAVLARAGLADSARAVLVRNRAGPDIDPTRELVGTEAITRVKLHDYDDAVRLLGDYLAANPAHRRGFATNSSPWWRDPQLQSHPGFKRLIAGAR